MKKIVFALAVLLLAAPAWATVDCNCTTVVGSEVVTVIFDARSEADPNVRAFALNITVDSGAKITGASNFNSDFNIYPGSIDINDTTGLVDNAGSPICDPCVYGDTLAGIGSGGMTIEMGSLYKKGTDPSPDPCGVLLTFTVDTDCTVTLAGNVSRAGTNGVVMEDPCATPTVNLGTCEVTGLECYAGQPDYAEWEAAGKPICWCYPRQCHGDADGLAQGNAFTGFMYVASNDLNVLISAWQIKEPPKGPGLSGNQACADFDHQMQGNAFTGFMRVASNDLNALITNWQVKEAPKGPGVPGDCLPGNETP